MKYLAEYMDITMKQAGTDKQKRTEFVRAKQQELEEVGVTVTNTLLNVARVYFDIDEECVAKRAAIQRLITQQGGIFQEVDYTSNPYRASTES